MSIIDLCLASIPDEPGVQAPFAQRPTEALPAMSKGWLRGGKPKTAGSGAQRCPCGKRRAEGLPCCNTCMADSEVTYVVPRCASCKVADIAGSGRGNFPTCGAPKCKAAAVRRRRLDRDRSGETSMHGLTTKKGGGLTR